MALGLASKILKDNDPLVLFAVELDGWVLDYASDRLKEDPEIVLAAVKQDPKAIEWAGKNIKNAIGDKDPIKCLELLILTKKIINKK